MRKLIRRIRLYFVNCEIERITYGDITELKPKLKEIHALRMKERGL